MGAHGQPLTACLSVSDWTLCNPDSVPTRSRSISSSQGAFLGASLTYGSLGLENIPPAMDEFEISSRLKPKRCAKSYIESTWFITPSGLQ